MKNSFDNYNLLIEKLDKFIRKYYTNKIIKGTIYFLTLIVVLFLTFNLLESQFYFNKAIRKSIFYIFIISTVIGFVYWLVWPLSKYFQLGRTISRERAASIIGNHFSNIKDKLLNVLQLHVQAESQTDNELLFAGIDQKSEEIKLVPFKSAIDLSKNKQYLKYLIPPILLLLLILLVSPGTIESSTKRIINNDKDFEQPAPFHFKIVNEKLEVVQFDDLDLKVSVFGEYTPSELYIDIDGYKYRLSKESDSLFLYHFKNIQKDLDFNLFSGKVISKDYKISVIPKPLITEFKVNIDYPAYTGQKDEELNNIGDLVILEGSKIKWMFNSVNTDSIKMQFDSNQKLYAVEKTGKNDFKLEKRIFRDDKYSVVIINKRIPNPDSINYSISVIKDKFPTISVEQFKDSLDDSVIYFLGEASDDYGFSSLFFNYKILDNNGNEQDNKKLEIKYNGKKNTSFKYFFDVASINLKPGNSIKYYFEVFDNDEINGAKSAKTRFFEFKKKTEEEFEKEEQDNEEDIKQNLDDIVKKTRKMQDELKRLKEKLLQKKNPEWQDKKELEKILKKQEELKKMLEEAKKKLDENLKKQQEYKKPNESILEKQEQIQKMFEESLSEEQKDLMEKIQEMMEELNKEEMMDKMEEMSMDQEKVEKQMDRLLELFKQLEVEKEIQETIDKLNELAEKQEKLGEETKKQDKNSDELEKKQEELNKEFEKVKEKLSDLTKKNKKLETPKNLAKDNEDKMEEIKDDMEKGKEQLEQNKPQNASQAQKSAAQKMKNMAKSLDMQMQGSSQEQHEEDIKALRQLLENILTLSFDEESLMDKTNGLIVNSPAYKKILKDQYRIKEDFEIVEDSLQALSKRVTEIETFVIDKVAEIKKGIKGSLDKLEDDGKYPGTRDFPGAIKEEHGTMKGLNDLALMLDESMQQMQKNGSGMPGSGSCNKPGGTGKKPGKSGEKPTDKIAKGQSALTKKMKSMLNKMKGKQGGDKGMAKEFAEAAKRQAEMRRALEKMKREKQGEGKGGGKDLQKLIDEMNKIEEDLVNKRLDAQMIKRQENITSRLLEADKADRKRGYDNQRKSKTASPKVKKMPPEVEKYLKERESQLEMYKSISPSLKPFYRKLVEDYIHTLKKK